MRTSSQQIPSDMGERCPWDPHLFACFRHEGCILLNQCHQFIRIKSETIEYCCSYSRACFTGAKEAQKPRMGIEHTRTGRLGMDGSPRSSEACAQLSIRVRHPTLKLVSWETSLCPCAPRPVFSVAMCGLLEDADCSFERRTSCSPNRNWTHS